VTEYGNRREIWGKHGKGEFIEDGKVWGVERIYRFVGITKNIKTL